MGLTPRDVSDRQRLEATATLALISLILSFALDQGPLIGVAAGFLLLGLVARTISALVAAAWLALTRRVGNLIYTLLLVLFYFLVLTPVALLARVFKGRGDGFQAGPPEGSLFAVRDHLPTPEEFEKPW